MLITARRFEKPGTRGMLCCRYTHTRLCRIGSICIIIRQFTLWDPWTRFMENCSIDDTMVNLCLLITQISAWLSATHPTGV